MFHTITSQMEMLLITPDQMGKGFVFNPTMRDDVGLGRTGALGTESVAGGRDWGLSSRPEAGTGWDWGLSPTAITRTWH